MEYWGLDIGGANTKVARIYAANSGQGCQTRCFTYSFPIWQRLADLPRFITSIAEDFPAEGKVAVTLTAELSDIFSSKREGVETIVGEVLRAFPSGKVSFLNIQCQLLSATFAQREPMSLAAANWIAAARIAARIEHEAIYLDIGSTTTDIVPLHGGKEIPYARTDAERLHTGELVYNGVIRTPLHQLARQVPINGRYYRVSPEYFAITADLHLVLGNISAEAYTWPAPDGKDAAYEPALSRIARLVCADLEQFGAEEIRQLCCYLYERQLQLLSDALLQVLSRFNCPLPLLLAGEGAFIGEELGNRLKLPVYYLSAHFSPEIGKMFPAWALAVLLAEQEEGGLLFGKEPGCFT